MSLASTTAPVKGLTVSTFRSVSDIGTVDVSRPTWAELIAEVKKPKVARSKAALPLIKFAEFGTSTNSKGSLRHDGNLIDVSGVEADYDDGVVSAEEAARRLRAARIAAVIYTTPSHTPAAPRWRVLAPFSGPVHPSLRAEHVSLLNGALGGILAPESWTLSQTYYIGAVEGVEYEAHEVKGEFLDVVSYCPTVEPIGPPQAVKQSVPKAERLAQVESTDPTAVLLGERGMVKSRRHDGGLNIDCPAADEHTTESGETATIYYPPHTGGFSAGNFKCMHGHCKGRAQRDFRLRLGYDEVLGDFTEAVAADGRPRFTPIAAAEFAAGPPPCWIIHGVLPQSEIATLFGASGSGKSFFVLDMAAAIAGGTAWRGHKVKQGRVVYVAAEGAGGFRKRLAALALHTGVELASLPLSVIPDCPNLLGDVDAKAMAAAIEAAGGAALIVIDTLAQATAGANENSGEDMGKVLAHCKQLHRATGALVLLVHHSGKDASQGARGWSGVRAAVDAEIEVSRLADGRFARVTKQKDGDDSEVFPFKLQQVVVGVDDEGGQVTSCVVVPTDLPPPVRKPLGAIQQRVLQTYKDLAFDGPVLVEALIAAAVAQIEKPVDGDDRRREVVRRAIAKLNEAAFFCVVNEYVQDPQTHSGPQSVICGFVGTTP